MSRGAYGISANVLGVLMKARPNPVHLNELIEATGASKEQVQRAASYLVSQNNGVRVVHKAAAWAYDETGAQADEPAPMGDTLFRLVGPTADGSLVLQHEDGSLWRATQL